MLILLIPRLQVMNSLTYLLQLIFNDEKLSV